MQLPLKFFFLLGLSLLQLQALGNVCSTIDNELASLRQSCAPKKVHLTFDDGPDDNVTPRILDALNRRGVKATFYISTHNLAANTINPTLINMINSGHVVGNHGHEHKAHDLRLLKNNDGTYRCDNEMLNHDESNWQIIQSQALLDQATGNRYSQQKNKLFRFPYGRGASPSPIEMNYIAGNGTGKNACNVVASTFPNNDSSNYRQNLAIYRQRGSDALMRLHKNGLDHVGWNFDSKDSVTNVANMAASNPSLYARDILKRLCEHKNNNIMSLFHDRGKAFNIAAIEYVIDVGRCLGINFVSHDELQSSAQNDSSYIQRAPANRISEVSAQLRILTTLPETGSVPGVICHEKENDSSLKCYSEYTKMYHDQCDGKASICIYGKWRARADPLVFKTCGFY